VWARSIAESNRSHTQLITHLFSLPSLFSLFFSFSFTLSVLFSAPTHTLPLLLLLLLSLLSSLSLSLSLSLCPLWIYVSTKTSETNEATVWREGWDTPEKCPRTVPQWTSCALLGTRTPNPRIVRSSHSYSRPECKFISFFYQGKMGRRGGGVRSPSSTFEEKQVTPKHAVMVGVSGEVRPSNTPTRYVHAR